ncbi:MAG: hypothetical protein ACREOK_07865 [Gemmatimonadaceae bacterium]
MSTTTIAFAVLAFASLEAQTATQVVRFQVTAINQIGVTGAPAPMVINSATAGSAPSSVTASGGSYAITTNEANKKITASLDAALPNGVRLEVSLAAPEGASSAGDVQLSTAGADLVTGISSLAASALPITYRLSADETVHMPVPATRTVTFTIVSGS